MNEHNENSENNEQPFDQPDQGDFLSHYGPLIGFGAAYLITGNLIWATASLVLCSVAAILYLWAVQKPIPKQMLVTTGFIVVFGSMTVFLNDDYFLKIKVTIINLVFASILLFGYMIRKYFLYHMFGKVFTTLSDEGWRQLTVRWIAFFLVCALLNEYIWRNYSNDVWVTFKIFGILGLTFIFTLLQLPLIRQYSDKDPFDLNNR